VTVKHFCVQCLKIRPSRIRAKNKGGIVAALSPARPDLTWLWRGSGPVIIIISSMARTSFFMQRRKWSELERDGQKARRAQGEGSCVDETTVTYIRRMHT